MTVSLLCGKVPLWGSKGSDRGEVGPEGETIEELAAERHRSRIWMDGKKQFAIEREA